MNISETANLANSIKVFDLFCGAGGLSQGIQDAGLTVVGGLDFEKSCQYPYEHNIGAAFIHKSITELKQEEINAFFEGSKYKVLVGCAPCQTFSSHTRKDRLRHTNEKWSLINEFLRVIEESNPHVVSMENVPGLAKQEIFESFVRSLDELGYKVSYSVVDCSEYCIPQARKRLVLLASRLGKIELLPPTSKQDKVTVEQTIGHLPQLNAGEADSRDPLHYSAHLSELNLERAKASIPGGTWKDWPEDLLLQCHKKESGKSYKSVYGRMEWDKPSPTITTQFFRIGTGRFIHPEQNRGLTPREASLIQTFPESFIFSENEEKNLTSVGRLIGNAVPVKLGEIIGLSIKQHIFEYNE